MEDDLPYVRKDALCRGMSIDIFFPIKEDGYKIKELKDLCSRCPVFHQCYTYAINAGEDLKGTWAGTSERERKRIRIANNKRKNSA